MNVESYRKTEWFQDHKSGLIKESDLVSILFMVGPVSVFPGPVSNGATDKATVVYGREDKLTTVTKGSETTRR